RPAWDKLSPSDQVLIKKYSKEAQLDERRLWKIKEKEAYDKMQAAGIQVVRITDKKPFQDAVKPLWDKYGGKYADLIKRIQAVS
ncbi:MAG: TRAP transporter substrate-binding protein, partial [Candidatus Eremiobacteraeota bacterium]|nr:TRAP transporter substrate-binding protein [Candidatus Eremiobacteraeota bacterium]